MIQVTILKALRNNWTISKFLFFLNPRVSPPFFIDYEFNRPEVSNVFFILREKFNLKVIKISQRISSF